MNGTQYFLVYADNVHLMSEVTNSRYKNNSIQSFIQSTGVY